MAQLNRNVAYSSSSGYKENIARIFLAYTTTTVRLVYAYSPNALKYFPLSPHTKKNMKDLFVFCNNPVEYKLTVFREEKKSDDWL